MKFQLFFLTDIFCLKISAFYKQFRNGGHVQTSANLCKPVQTSANQCKPEQTSANLCKPVQTSGNLCKPVQT
jgi:hypothetical protein